MLPQTRFQQSRRSLRIITFGLLLAAVWWGAAALSDSTGSATLPQSLWGALGGFLLALAAMWVISAQRNRTPHKKARVPKSIWGGPLLAMLYPLSVILWLAFDLSGQVFAVTTQWLTGPVFLMLNLAAVLLIGPLANLTGWASSIAAWARQAFPRQGGKLFLGLIWWLWHLPFIFINGTALARLHFSGLWLALYLGTVLGISYLFTWGYDKKRRDVLSTAFKHF